MTVNHHLPVPKTLAWKNLLTSAIAHSKKLASALKPSLSPPTHLLSGRDLRRSLATKAVLPSLQKAVWESKAPSCSPFQCQMFSFCFLFLCLPSILFSGNKNKQRVAPQHSGAETGRSKWTARIKHDVQWPKFKVWVPKGPCADLRPVPTMCGLFRGKVTTRVYLHDS